MAPRSALTQSLLNGALVSYRQIVYSDVIGQAMSSRFVPGVVTAISQAHKSDVRRE